MSTEWEGKANLRGGYGVQGVMFFGSGNNGSTGSKLYQFIPCF